MVIIMYFLNRVDEQNRFLGLKAYDQGQIGQDYTHTYSYLFARKQLQKSGMTMGLEKLIQEKESQKKVGAKSNDLKRLFVRKQALVKG